MTSVVGPCVRLGFTQNGYIVQLQDGNAGNGIYVLAPSFNLTPLATGVTSVSPGDVWRLVISGSLLTLFQNGIKRYQVSDSTYPTSDDGGGFWANSLNTVTSNASISHWSAGSAILNTPSVSIDANNNCTLSSVDSPVILTYTIDGSTPSPGSNGTVYTGPFPILPGTTVKVISSHDGYTNSAVGTGKANDVIFGFSPNYYFNQQSAGLAIYVSPGEIDGKLFLGQVVFVPANATTNISMDVNGNIQLRFGAHLYPIATVISGNVQTAGTPNTFPNGGPVTSPGIVNIQDMRPTTPFSF